MCECYYPINSCLHKFGKAKMADFESLLNSFMTRDQFSYLIGQLVEKGILDKENNLNGRDTFNGKK